MGFKLQGLCSVVQNREAKNVKIDPLVHLPALQVR